ncbi:hypothetical protein MKX01_037047 [Papaver californicum]|nr:hypothetical protein MKX01_037047 [Papaver californicum]
MIICQESNCKETLEPYLGKDIISGQVLNRRKNALCESSVPTSKKIYCPLKDCSVMLVNNDDGVIIRSTECPYCNMLFCAKKSWRVVQDVEDMLLIRLARDQKWTRCPSSRFYVEKLEDCPHITCKNMETHGQVVMEDVGEYEIAMSDSRKRVGLRVY